MMRLKRSISTWWISSPAIISNMNTVPPEPAQSYLALRERILHLQPAEIGLNPTSETGQVWGVLMETGYPEGTATLVCLADGTTSLYYSTGGGMMGSPSYSPLADASRAMVAQAELLLPQLTLTKELPLPEVGQVRFIALTFSGLFAGDASEPTLAAGKHILTPLFEFGHKVLSELRLLNQPRQK